MSQIYQPSKDIISKVNRKLVPFQAQRKLNIKLNRPMVSFSFDDCPKSVIDNALKPIEAEDWQATIYVAMGLCDTTNHLGLHMCAADVKAAHQNGHEIADHTFSHIDGAQHDVDDFLADIDKNQGALAELDIPPSTGFAYPYGQVTRKLKIEIAKRFQGARGISSRLNKGSVDLNQIGANRLYTGSSFKSLIQEISCLEHYPGWLRIYTHDVRENPSQFGCTPAQMREVVKAVKDVGAQVLTMAEAINHLEAAYA